MEEKIKMLIVDSEEEDRKELRSILNDDAYSIIEAEDGESALAIISAQKIDVILMALTLKGMSGFEFLKTIKSDERYFLIPVILTAVRGDYDSEVKALALGADNLILKPYNSELVCSWTKQLVERYVKHNRRMEKKLKNATYKYESLMATVPGGIAVVNYDERMELEYFSDGLCEILGYSREELELLGKNGIDDMVMEADRQILYERFQVAQVDGAPANMKLRLYCKYDVIKWVTISARQVFSEENASTFHAVIIDVTGEHEAERELMNSKIELQYRAERDSLTGIYNREMFYRQARVMIDKNPDEKYLVAQWNIDHFRIVNELFGSNMGDRILCTIANKLSQYMKGNGVYARLEADNFVTCTTAEYIEQHLEKIEHILEGEGLENELHYPLMIHAGFYYVKDNNMAVSSMCDRAGMAVKHIKNNCLKRWYEYNSKMKEQMVNEQELVNDMAKALEQHQFFVVYQPIIDAKTQRMISAEALVRWNHPKKGFISPGVFIPLFEKNGFITKLDHYVCEEVCSYLSARQKQGKKIVPVSVNLSRINFYNHNLCEEIIELTQKYDLEPRYLKLEVTESAYTDNPLELINMIDMFQRNGFQVLMDDFGSGYSSLNMLKDVSVDILKIDMKFMEELEVSNRANNILFSIIQMAKALDMNIVGEGVETQNQYELLASMGCDSIQGYYFSKPIPSDEFAVMLDNHLDEENEILEKMKPVVLVVDDSSESRRLIKEAIGTDYHVVEASDGEEALKILKKDFMHISLVITDLHMPNVSGAELLGIMNCLSYLKKIPVLVISNQEDEDISKVLQLGALDVIGPDCNKDITQLRIRNILKLSRNATIEKEIYFLRQEMTKKEIPAE